MSPLTRVCRLTPAGRGAVATIGVIGNVNVVDSHFRAANSQLIANQPVRRICFGRWGDEAREEVVCLKTAPDTVEVHCHGGLAAVDRILQDMQGSGCEIISQPEWQRLTSDEMTAECIHNVARATTRLAMHHAVRQQTLFVQAIRDLENLPPTEALESIETMLQWGSLARHLLTPWKVVLCGPPNVGKSSLINALVGYERTVVFNQPGTTRDVIEVETAFQGWPVTLSDTAGIREAASDLEAAGIARAKSQLETADLILVVGEATGSATIPSETLSGIAVQKRRILNKADLVKAQSPDDGLPVSAVTGEGLPELINQICEDLIPSPLPQDQAFPMSDAQFRLLEERRASLSRP